MLRMVAWLSRRARATSVSNPLHSFAGVGILDQDTHLGAPRPTPTMIDIGVARLAEAFTSADVDAQREKIEELMGTIGRMSR